MPHLRRLMRGKALTALQSYWLLMFPLVLLLPGIFSFPYPSAQAQYSDLAITHYPNAVYLRHAIETWHTLPLWSPLILSGYPFVANPLAGIWYLPGWIAYLFPLPFGFNLLVGLHLLVGGIGMYKLLRAEGLGYRPALFGALAFEAMPKLFAHYGAGHLTLLYAIPWTPWLLLAWKAPGLRVQIRRIQWRVPASLILALIFLADVRWAAYAGLLWLGYALVTNPGAATLQGVTALAQRGKAIVWQLIQAGLLAAPLGLPLLEYMRLSSRAEMTMRDIFTYSLPPARLLGLLIPDFGGFQEFALYPGLVVLLLAGLGLLSGLAWSRAKFWIWAAVISLIYALGDHLPIFIFAGKLPGINLLRVPARALFVTGMALIVLAAYSLDKLMSERLEASKGLEKTLRKTRLFLAGLLAFVLILMLAVEMATKSLPFNFVWSCLIITGFWIWFELSTGRRLASPIAYAVLIGLCLLDLAAVDFNAYSPRPTAEVLAEGAPAIEMLPDATQLYRVYSPSYSLPQQTASLAGLELADGVDPLQLQSYVNFMRQASGINWQGYSVTLPAFPNGEPESDNAWAKPDPKLLGLLNVRYVVTAFELISPGLVQSFHGDGTWIYENQQALPRAWLQPAEMPAGDDVSPVEITLFSPNRISLKVPPSNISGNQKLVLSEINYPGWQVTVDGKPGEIETEADLLRSVRVPAGNHEVVFIFRPTSLVLGLVSAVFGLLITFDSGRRWARDPSGFDPGI